VFPYVLRQDDIQADVPGVFYILFLIIFFIALISVLCSALVYILVENGYLSPPPLKIYIFSQKKQRDFRATLPTTK
jgi:hypothetical protein